jgi:apolipoprotein N-acyltransferase
MKPFPLKQGLALCVLSAALVCLSFPNFLDKTLTPWGAPLAWVALIPFFLALQEAGYKRGALFGWVFGFAQFGGILYWVAFLREAQYLSVPAWAALVFYLSLYFLVFGLLFSWAKDRLKWIFGLWIPVSWVGLETIRGNCPFGGFPWGQLGYACAPYPSFLFWSSILGVYGLTFLLVWVNGMWARGLYLWRRSEKAIPRGPVLRNLLLPAVLIAALGIAGRWEVARTPLTARGSVAIVQPNIDQSVKWNRAYAQDTYRRLGESTERVGKNNPDLILWPETAAPSFLLWTPGDLQRVSAIVRAAKVPVLVGCLDLLKSGKNAEADYNAAVYFGADGKPLGVYRKRHLVPFGEYVPFQKYLVFLGPVVGDLGSFEPGPAYASFKTKNFSFSPVICYEAIFPGDIREATAGADVLVNISNDAWYGRTACAYQHAMMAVVRAAEEHKPLVRCANTGISLATDPLGRLLGQTQLYEETSLTAPVLTTAGPTFYFQAGHWFAFLCLLLSFLGILGLAVTRKKEETHA